MTTTKLHLIPVTKLELMALSQFCQKEADAMRRIANCYRMVIETEKIYGWSTTHSTKQAIIHERKMRQLGERAQGLRELARS